MTAEQYWELIHALTESNRKLAEVNYEMTKQLVEYIRYINKLEMEKASMIYNENKKRLNDGNKHPYSLN